MIETEIVYLAQANGLTLTLSHPVRLRLNEGVHPIGVEIVDDVGIAHAVRAWLCLHAAERDLRVTTFSDGVARHMLSDIVCWKCGESLAAHLVRRGFALPRRPEELSSAHG